MKTDTIYLITIVLHSPQSIAMCGFVLPFF